MTNRVAIDRRLSVAPMLDWTDRYCRYFHRLLSKQALLYTEMITTGALLFNEPARFLDFFSEEHPLALQLGGSNPEHLGKCCHLAQEWQYDEVNLNLGCPSDRVQSGKFGACLMAEPALVAECISAMTESCSLPISAKHRIGIDDLDSYDLLTHFVDTLAAAGCQTFIVHARKAWLQGLSPKQNRDVPPLRYEIVYRLKQDFPQLEIIINGGVMNLTEANQHLQHVDGVMIGREVYHNPWMLSQADKQIYGSTRQPLNRHGIVEAFLPLVEQECSRGVPLKRLTRHILGLFHGQPGAKKWRRYLSENAHKPDAGPETLMQALALVPNSDSD